MSNNYDDGNASGNNDEENDENENNNENENENSYENENYNETNNQRTNNKVSITNNNKSLPFNKKNFNKLANILELRYQNDLIKNSSDLRRSFDEIYQLLNSGKSLQNIENEDKSKIDDMDIAIIDETKVKRNKNKEIRSKIRKELDQKNIAYSLEDYRDGEKYDFYIILIKIISLSKIDVKEIITNKTKRFIK